MAGKTIYQVRKENLRRYVDEHGGPSSVAKTLGLSGPSYVSQLSGAEANRPFSERTARKWEEKLGLPAHWFDVERDTRGQAVVAQFAKGTSAEDYPPPVSQKHAVEENTAEYRKPTGHHFPPGAQNTDRIAELVALIASAISAEHKSPPADKIGEIVQILMEMKQEEATAKAELARRLVRLAA